MNKLYIFPTLLLLTIVMATTRFIPENTEFLTDVMGTSFSTDTGPYTEQISEVDGMTIVYVPAGFFMMGSDPVKDAAGEADEKPQHKVFVGSFWIDKTEVTNAMYARYLNEKESQGVVIVTAQGENGNLTLTGNGWIVEADQENLPVTNVTWFEAQSYCEWAGRRLPTEAEWEKAARGEAGAIYSWGDENPDCSKAAFQGCGDTALNAGSLTEGQSVYGVYDMTGNVWEWVFDYYDEAYYKRHDVINPTGPDYEYYTLVLRQPLHGAVIKGGSWVDEAVSLRAANRVEYSRIESTPLIGFRCAVSGLSGLIIN